MAALGVTAVMFVAAPAAATTVTVRLDVSALQPFATVPIAGCAVQVQAGSDAIDVLEAGRRAGCIDSYQTETHPEFGRYLTCIDGICGTDATYWRMTVDGAATSYGVDDYAASGGDDLGFSYTTWVGCLADPSLC